MDKKKLAVTLISVIIIIISITFLVALNLFKDESEILIAKYGFLGIFVIVFMMDFFIQPISPDFIVFGTSLINDNIFTIALVAGISSVCAGVVDHLIGRRIGKVGFTKWFGEKHVNKGHEIFEKWGALAVILGALSPLPYGAVCWLSGVYRMHIGHFIFFALLARIPRFLIFASLGNLF